MNGATGVRAQVMTAAEHREGIDLFHLATGRDPIGDAHWQSLADTAASSTMWRILVSGHPAGMIETWPADMVVPGGQRLPVTVLGRLAVHPDRVGGGLARTLVETAFRATAEPAILLQSRPRQFYQRFGCGPATRARDIIVDSGVARPHQGAPAAGRIRTVPAEQAARLLPELYERCRRTTGSVGRAGYYEPLLAYEVATAGVEMRVLVHSGPDGDDGFARVARTAPDHGGAIEVWDLHSRTAQAWAGLWRAVVEEADGGEVQAPLRPLDEPVDRLFTDPRSCRAAVTRDVIWLRPHDVVPMLRSRPYGGAEPLVLEVSDPFPGTAPARCLIGDGQVVPTDQPAELRIGAADLGALFLGDVSASALAVTGRLTVLDPAALPVADRLFATSGLPWAGTTV